MPIELNEFDYIPPKSNPYPSYPYDQKKTKTSIVYNESIRNLAEVMLAASIGGFSCAGGVAFWKKRKKSLQIVPIKKPKKKKAKKPLKKASINEIQKSKKRRTSIVIEQNPFLPTKEEQEHIEEMINKTATPYYLKHHNRLRALGKKIDHILPFRFLAFILLIPKNKNTPSGVSQLKTIIEDGGYFDVNRFRREMFLNELAESINTKYEDPKSDYSEFCKLVCPKSIELEKFKAELKPFYKEKNWQGLVKKVLEII